MNDAKNGDSVTAKRFGWDDDETDENFSPDVTPYADYGYESDDLIGLLSIIETPEVTAYLVGGQEADPKTIRKS